MSKSLDVEGMNPAKQAQLRASILAILPEAKRREVEHMPLSFIVYLHPGIAEFGPRFPLWDLGMTHLEELFDSWENPAISIDLRDTYYLYTVSPADLMKRNLRNGRGNNILAKLPPFPPENQVEERVQRAAGMFGGSPTMGCMALNLFSTFMLAEDFIQRITPYQDEVRWEQALDEHHKFCLRNGIDY